MDAADADIKQAFDGMVKNTKCGASVWTTFVWLANLVFGLCWIIALPCELLLNRRIGRRYASLLPLLAALPVFWLFVGLGQGVVAKMFATMTPTDLGRMGVPTAAFQTMWVSVALFGLVMLMLLGHRVSNWQRFRTSDQVHSFSNGIPCWVLPPKWSLKILTPEKDTDQGQTPAPAVTSDGGSIAEVKATPQPVATGMIAVARDAWAALRAHLAQEFRTYVQEWRRGEVPTGAITWYAATIVHPLVLFIAAGFVGILHVGFGVYLSVAAIAIFIKARIQKALMVETVYDIFDSRIEQSFRSSLSDPLRLRSVERTGYIVPGVARVAASAAASSQAAADVDPRYADLLNRS